MHLVTRPLHGTVAAEKIRCEEALTNIQHPFRVRHNGHTMGKTLRSHPAPAEPFECNTHLRYESGNTSQLQHSSCEQHQTKTKNTTMGVYQVCMTRYASRHGPMWCRQQGVHVTQGVHTARRAWYKVFVQRGVHHNRLALSNMRMCNGCRHI